MEVRVLLKFPNFSRLIQSRVYILLFQHDDVGTLTLVFNMMCLYVPEVLDFSKFKDNSKIVFTSFTGEIYI